MPSYTALFLSSLVYPNKVAMANISFGGATVESHGLWNLVYFCIKYLQLQDRYPKVE